MALVKVKILSSIAGENFSYSPGDIVELDETIARAWVEHGLALYALEGDVAAAQVADLQKQLKDASGARDGLAKTKTDLEGKLAKELAEKKGAVAEREIHKRAAQDTAASLATAEKAATDAAAKAAATIADLTKERDEYRAQAESLGAQLAEALAELEKLKGAPAPSPSAPAAASSSK